MAGCLGWSVGGGERTSHSSVTGSEMTAISGPHILRAGSSLLLGGASLQRPGFTEVMQDSALSTLVQAIDLSCTIILKVADLEKNS